jgi:hypothetical protein
MQGLKKTLEKLIVASIKDSCSNTTFTNSDYMPIFPLFLMFSIMYKLANLTVPQGSVPRADGVNFTMELMDSIIDKASDKLKMKNVQGIKDAVKTWIQYTDIDGHVACSNVWIAVLSACRKVAMMICDTDYESIKELIEQGALLRDIPLSALKQVLTSKSKFCAMVANRVIFHLIKAALAGKLNVTKARKALARVVIRRVAKTCFHAAAAQAEMESRLTALGDRAYLDIDQLADDLWNMIPRPRDDKIDSGRDATDAKVKAESHAVIKTPSVKTETAMVAKAAPALPAKASASKPVRCGACMVAGTEGRRPQQRLLQGRGCYQGMSREASGLEGRVQELQC